MGTADIRAQDKTRADNIAQILSARYCLPVVVYKPSLPIVAAVSAQLVQNLQWPHDTRATPERTAMRCR